MKGGGWTAAKVGISRDQSWVGLDNRGLDENAEGYANLREALGRDFDIAVHCHWEFDFNSALRWARVVAPIRPFWMEDPMPIEFNEQWVRLTAQSPVPILCEENLYRRPAFRPFIE